jgi:hypothetical protein
MAPVAMAAADAAFSSNSKSSGAASSSNSAESNGYSDSQSGGYSDSTSDALVQRVLGGKSSFTSSNSAQPLSSQNSKLEALLPQLRAMTEFNQINALRRTNGKEKKVERQEG